MSYATGPLPHGRGSDTTHDSDELRESDQSRETDGAQRDTFDEDAAWAEFYAWAAAPCWGPDCESTPRQQFDACVAKLTELGLPVAGVR